MVIMWQFLFSLIWSIIAASVVDFPLPVGPVSRISPLSFIAKLFTKGGIPSSSELLISLEIVLKTADNPFI